MNPHYDARIFHDFTSETMEFYKRYLGLNVTEDRIEVTFCLAQPLIDCFIHKYCRKKSSGSGSLSVTP